MFLTKIKNFKTKQKNENKIKAEQKITSYHSHPPQKNLVIPKGMDDSYVSSRYFLKGAWVYAKESGCSGFRDWHYSWDSLPESVVGQKRKEDPCKEGRAITGKEGEGYNWRHLKGSPTGLRQRTICRLLRTRSMR